MTIRSVRGFHVLWAVIAFFALIIGADVFFITKAIATFPGEQVKNSYVLGLDFNSRIEQRNLQAELGWRAQAGLTGDGELVVRIRTEDDRPVRGLRVSATLFQPGVKGSEQRLMLGEGPAGEYAAPVATTSGARIDLAISAAYPGDDARLFEAAKTLAAP